MKKSQILMFGLCMLSSVNSANAAGTCVVPSNFNPGLMQQPGMPTAGMPQNMALPNGGASCPCAINSGSNLPGIGMQQPGIQQPGMPQNMALPNGGASCPFAAGGMPGMMGRPPMMMPPTMGGAPGMAQMPGSYPPPPGMMVRPPMIPPMMNRQGVPGMMPMPGSYPPPPGMMGRPPMMPTQGMRIGYPMPYGGMSGRPAQCCPCTGQQSTYMNPPPPAYQGMGNMPLQGMSKKKGRPGFRGAAGTRRATRSLPRR